MFVQLLKCPYIGTVILLFDRYERECDEVDGKRAYHGGINYVMNSPPGGIEKDDIECNYSDEVDSVIEIFENDEKPISSLINVQSTKWTLHSEVN